MKRCAYCGRENDESATACSGCGGAEFKLESAQSAETKFEARSQATGLPALWRKWLSNPIAVYRILIVVSFGTYVLWFLLPFMDRYFLSDETIDILSAHGYGAILPIPLRVSWMVFFINLVVAPGLWFFCISARWVYVCVVVFFLVLRPLAGVQVDSAIGSFLGSVGALADGALIVLSFTSPIRDKFEEFREKLEEQQ